MLELPSKDRSDILSVSAHLSMVDLDLRRAERWRFGVVKARAWELVDPGRWGREAKGPSDDCEPERKRR